MESRRYRSGRRCTLFALVAFTAFAAPSFLDCRAQPSSIRVRLVARLHHAFYVGPSPYVQFQPDYKLVLSRIRRPIALSGGYEFGTGFHFLELDPRTGKETPISGLNKHFPVTASQSIGYWRLSPDARWLFWPEEKRHSTWYAARFDGTQVVSWPQPKGDAVDRMFPRYAWTPDSRRWVALVQRGSRLAAVIGALDQPGIVRQIRNVHAIKSDAGAPNYCLLGVTPANKAVAAIWKGGQDKGVLLFEFSIDEPNPASRSLAVSLPHRRFILDLAFSPRGDRLGWVFISPDNASRDELWMSRADGSHFRKLAEVSFTTLFPNRTQDWEYHPEFLTWTPDGKNLSFVYKDTVCTVKAE